MDEEEESSQTSRRLRTFTDKARQNHFERRDRVFEILSRIRDNAIQIAEKVNANRENREFLVEARQLLLAEMNSYHSKHNEYKLYLESQNTVETIEELVMLTSLYKELEAMIIRTIRYIDDMLKPKPTEQKDEDKTVTKPVQNQSVYAQSNKSGRSSTSSRSSKAILMEKQSKLESAKVRLKMIEEEERLKQEQYQLELKVKEERAISDAQLEQQRSNLESELNVLRHKREVAEAEAELTAVKEVLDKNDNISQNGGNENSSLTKESLESLPAMPTSQRVEAYVLNPNVKEFVPKKIKDEICQTTFDQFKPKTYDSQKETRYVHQTPSTTERVYIEKDNSIGDFTKFLLKKDLLIQRLTEYDDRPERYFNWKIQFRKVVSELELCTSEHLDLLIRWLGPQSKEQAISIRIANAHNEELGLRKIWNRLDERYGSPEKVAASLKYRLAVFPKIQDDYKKMYQLSDLLCEISSVKDNEHYSTVLSSFDSSYGVNEIVQKLPGFLKSKWIDKASMYKSRNDVMFPPFEVFADFVHDMAVRLNDPCFDFERSDGKASSAPKKNFIKFNNKPKVQTNKTRVEPEETQCMKTEIDKVKNETPKSGLKTIPCPLHKEGKHTISDCRLFLSKPLIEKREIVRSQGICFKCLYGNHLAKDCELNIKCSKCGSTSHCVVFHIDKPKPTSGHGGESKSSLQESEQLHIETKCTEICKSSSDDNFEGKSCDKTLLVNIYREGKPGKSLKTYAIIDDQSNKSLVKSKLLDFFNDESELISYTLASCAGKTESTGRRANGYIVESLDNSFKLSCPPLTECNDIPNSKREIASPSIAKHYAHLHDIEPLIPEIDTTAEVLLLIGRDMLPAHHVLEQKIGQANEPFAQCLRLGWAIIGQSCLGQIHTTDQVSVCKTSILPSGRETYLKPCEYSLKIRDQSENKVTGSIFQKTDKDNEPGLSQEDRVFLSLMEQGFSKSTSGKLSAPLPLRQNRSKLPNNYVYAKNRAVNLAKSLEKDNVKREHFLEFMRKIFTHNQAEEAPKLDKDQEVWYLPIFGVYHAKKPSKIRVVFDSAAKYEGVSLNDILMKGPDLTNNLVGVLSKFRQGQVAAMADVEQMFFNFEVDPNYRDYLRFIWFKDNDVTKPLIDYRMKVHVFGNAPSPSIATYGLRKAVCNNENPTHKCDEVCQFVRDNFYVDDALISRDEAHEVVDLISKTQDRLEQGGKIRLHKIVSNSSDVLDSFPSTDLADGISGIDFENESCFHRSLGMIWDIAKDEFTYRLNTEEKPFTKRGLLSFINGVFDPLGFIAPVIIKGRIIMREAIKNNSLAWDEPLPSDLNLEWKKWVQSLKDIENLRISRPFMRLSCVNQLDNCELHIFSDASKAAISAVGYLYYPCDSDISNSQVGFVLGKSKIAPTHGHTIPRLELCAALLATDLATFLQKQLSISRDRTFLYTDSQVVLGYLNNESRRFYVYVSNRVDRILSVSKKDQWHYVSTSENPADQGTRPLEATNLCESLWLKGPKQFLDSCTSSKVESNSIFEMINPDNDKEVRPLVQVKKTDVSTSCLGTDRFSRFSSWLRLVRAIARLKQVLTQRSNKNNSVDIARNKVDMINDSECLIVREVQNEYYRSEISALRNKEPLPKDSSILDLSPMLDLHGILRVGGRLKNARLDRQVTNPIILPGKSHIATLIVRHFHELNHHQGRHYTEGAIRSNGFWITGCKKLVSTLLHKCITCRKLRTKSEYQQMADLPSDRVNPAPPFTFVAVDTFGPWQVAARRTRGGIAQSKRYAIMFTCLVIRAVHIEVIEELTSSCFINALRRFVSIRGPVKEFRSDRGTNFVGSVNELGIEAINVEDPKIANYLLNNKMIWKFSSPQSSHMNGAVERMIGLARRIFEPMLANNHKNLSHDVLCTFMAEVSCIMNSRPISSVSHDPSLPTILSPNTLLTQKLGNSSDLDCIDELSLKDMYKSQWRHVQVLANQFWKQWSSQYLHNLQSRKKWTDIRPNLKENDIVLVMEENMPRNFWPVGIIENVFPSSDGLVRKVSVRIIKDGDPILYTRPITKLVYLMS